MLLISLLTHGPRTWGKVWDAKTGQCLKVLSNDADPTLPSNASRDSGVTCVALNPVDGRSVVAVRLFLHRVLIEPVF